MYLKQVSTRTTPQSEPILDREQVQNNAGGYVFAVSNWDRLLRWLVLGSESGSYYVGEREMTLDNAKNVLACIAEDGERTVNVVVQVSDAGRAPKNDPALFALALCASKGDQATRSYALRSLNKVARTGYHLFQFVDFVTQFRGWGRGLREAIARWYSAKTDDSLAYQLVKYQQRGGWSHRDLLRLAHPKVSGVRQNMFRWVVKSELATIDGAGLKVPDLVFGSAIVNTAADEAEVIRIIREYKLPWDAIPSQWLGSAKVWEELLPNLPMTATIRNLARMTTNGTLGPLSYNTRMVVDRLTNTEHLKAARAHPIQLLSALKVYEQGHGERGKLSWNPLGQIVDALNDAFYMSFGWIEPTGKRILLALDVSSSMDGGTIAGVPGLTPRVASAAMAMVIANIERNHEIVVFASKGTQFINSRYGGQVSNPDDGITQIALSPTMRLDDVIRKTGELPFGGTDCALPMLWAAKNKVPVDAFEIMTDNQTWAGVIHPYQALQQYREVMGIPACMVVVGMTATEFSIADPADSRMLDVVGFDTAAPNLISDFIAGKV